MYSRTSLAIWLKRALGSWPEQGVVQFDFLETIQDAEVDVERFSRLPAKQVSQALVRLQASHEVERILEGVKTARTASAKKPYQAQFKLVMDRAIEDVDPVVLEKKNAEKRVAILTQQLAGQEKQVEALTKRLVEVEFVAAI